MTFRNIDRRDFLKSTALGMAALALPGFNALGAQKPVVMPKRFCAPDRKMNIACVGCGGKGEVDVMGVAGENIVALCDVDSVSAHKMFSRFPDVPHYKDYRQMLTDFGDKIDAITVTTPDHMHYPIALMAMEMGKHVYVQKPLTQTVWEARELTAAAHRYGVITQMGNQGHAGEGTRLLKEWVEAGAIGPVREVHIWTNRPWIFWPQGMERPVAEQKAPDTMDWNRWLGVAPERPYNSCYAPFKWRGWWDYGCGALGDMACHLMDASFWALNLRAPLSIEAECDGLTDDTAPKWSIITYKFPARGHMPPVTLKWYDGYKLPPRPKELEADRKLSSGGQILIGDHGTIMDTSDYCESPRIIPETKMREFKRPPQTIPRVPKSDPYLEWINACKGGPMCGSNFDHAGPLTEMVVLGNVAIRHGKKIQWDHARMRCTNVPEADRFLRRNYRTF